jgi:hypothetical protein
VDETQHEVEKKMSSKDKKRRELMQKKNLRAKLVKLKMTKCGQHPTAAHAFREVHDVDKTMFVAHNSWHFAALQTNPGVAVINCARFASQACWLGTSTTRRELQNDRTEEPCERHSRRNKSDQQPAVTAHYETGTRARRPAEEQKSAEEEEENEGEAGFGWISGD